MPHTLPRPETLLTSLSPHPTPLYLSCHTTPHHSTSPVTPPHTTPLYLSCHYTPHHSISPVTPLHTTLPLLSLHTTPLYLSCHPTPHHSTSPVTLPLLLFPTLPVTLHHSTPAPLYSASHSIPLYSCCYINLYLFTTTLYFFLPPTTYLPTSSVTLPTLFFCWCSFPFCLFPRLSLLPISFYTLPLPSPCLKPLSVCDGN
ncbi:hypothetical protein Pmani_033783 [Petrolisthes manimaculis]|uniref:Uncharacterized protein n=1 Tax=Petrolisthes manimaculis TaxID=1843537 RepID=A0AAE1TSC7_9EUCA|nr:hypothetical protein Pmani_033783 [Petrolisthes manimaculis]